VNAQTENIFEYSREELVGQTQELVVPEPFRNQQGGYGAAFPREPRGRGMGGGLELFARPKKTAQFSAENSLIPSVFCSIKLYSAIQDASDRNSAAGGRRRSRRKEELFCEINQRVKNNLQAASGLNLRAGQLADPAARLRFETGARRIRCIAWVDERGGESGTWGSAPSLAGPRALDGKLRARLPGGPEFEIVFPREASRK
jgi:two-component system, sensor histidine kinase PdtaS